jgi:phosphorylase/glycogen(starch) synthase
MKRDLTLRQESPTRMLQASEALREDALLIGFARRFATYKRAALLFSNPKRLNRLVNDPDRPVQFLFAGKAHPADKGGQELIRRIVEMARQPEFVGKIFFLENYDMSLARRLVQGVDL